MFKKNSENQLKIKKIEIILKDIPIQGKENSGKNKTGMP